MRKTGVVVATGDYTNDDEMMAYYNPDMNHLDRKETNKTGDGQKMMVWLAAAWRAYAAPRCSMTSTRARLYGRHAVS